MSLSNFLSLSLSLSLHHENPKPQHSLSKKKPNTKTHHKPQANPQPRQSHRYNNYQTATHPVFKPLLSPLLPSPTSTVAVSIHPKPIYSHQLFLIIIFTETQYQTNLANTETHHQTHQNKSPNPSKKITTTIPKSNQPNATQIRPKRQKPMNKPTPKTHEQTHDLRASTTKADRASMPLKKREQKERERKIMKIMK